MNQKERKRKNNKIKLKLKKKPTIQRSINKEKGKGTEVEIEDIYKKLKTVDSKGNVMSKYISNLKRENGEILLVQ